MICSTSHSISSSLLITWLLSVISLSGPWGVQGFNRLIWKVRWICPYFLGRCRVYACFPTVSIISNGPSNLPSSFLLGCLMFRFFVDRRTLSPIVKVMGMCVLLCCQACNLVVCYRLSPSSSQICLRCLRCSSSKILDTSVKSTSWGRFRWNPWLAKNGETPDKEYLELL